MKLIWADRVALVCLGLLAILLCAAWRDPNTSPFSIVGIRVLWEFGRLVIGVPWLLMRALDLLLTGRVRLVATPLRPRRPDIVVMPPPQARPLAPRDIVPSSRAPLGLRE